jgi:dihydrofolate reductase
LSQRVVVHDFLTLDGVMQAPGDPNEDSSGGFEHGGWQLDYFDDIFGNAVMGFLSNCSGLLFGRRTYETFANFWPNQPDDDPLAGTFNALPKYVVSTTLSEPLPWKNSTLIADDVVRNVTKLREQDGKDIQVIGSGELVQTLIRNNLVDEYRIMIHPLLLGTGKRLFRELDAPIRLRLVDSQPTTKGVLILSYEPA